MEKDTPMNETIDGLLGIMPIGMRSVQYIPESATAKIDSNTSTLALPTQTAGVRR